MKVHAVDLYVQENQKLNQVANLEILTYNF